ncbi:Acylneuraminate cytidylyltransferase [Arabidopsis thaliana x Arabidopsis arenosa]|uniref:Acylneuraminate cytidylyltransferase n=1 Tax=Arabidopsis thaliana x Arabidopsis arenosa TaxID=1240361 RepID=A0A8T2A5V5_9BRAS|nr:Acylneuraminate cytidylyltransferase [Arabidopsis thaliana x Arabidopsis arenosa]
MFPERVVPTLLQAAVLVRENKAAKAEELLGQVTPDAVFSTAVTSLKPEDGLDPNRVKCVVDNRGYAIYFSRGLIPYNKSGKVNPDFPYMLHLGNQSFDSKFLKVYSELQPTPLQQEEDLEQLKVLENGYKMKVIKVDHEAHGVDTPDDVEKIESLMRERICISS